MVMASVEGMDAPEVDADGDGKAARTLPSRVWPALVLRELGQVALIHFPILEQSLEPQRARQLPAMRNLRRSWRAHNG